MITSLRYILITTILMATAPCPLITPTPAHGQGFGRIVAHGKQPTIILSPKTATTDATIATDLASSNAALDITISHTRARIVRGNQATYNALVATGNYDAVEWDQEIPPTSITTGYTNDPLVFGEETAPVDTTEYFLKDGAAGSAGVNFVGAYSRPPRLSFVTYTQGASALVNRNASICDNTTVAVNTLGNFNIGDFLLAYITATPRPSPITITPPSGWTLVATVSHGTKSQSWVYRHVVADGDDSTITFSFPSADICTASLDIADFISVHGASPIDGTAILETTTSGTAIAVPALSATANYGDMVVAFYEGAVTSATFTPPAQVISKIGASSGTMVELSESSTEDLSWGIARMIQPKEGTTRASSATLLTSSPDGGSAIVVALRSTAGIDVNPSRYVACGEGGNMIVAVLDSGVETAHYDMSPNLDPVGAPGWNFLTNTSNTNDTTASSPNGHGTQVAGVVAARGYNFLGSAGGAFTCRIMPIVITTGTTGYTSNQKVMQGLDWARTHGAKIAVISFAMFPLYVGVENAAMDFYNAGGLVFISAGNVDLTGGCLSPTLPNSPWVIAITSTDSGDNKAGHACNGTHIDLSAPGVNICTSRRGNFSSCFNVSGTSISNPLAASLAALRWGTYDAGIGGFLDTNAKVEAWMKSSAIDLGAAGYDPVFGTGRIHNDVSQAINP